MSAKELLSIMLKNLSDWLLFRRNVEGSAGGKFLKGVATNLAAVNEDINDYIKHHFLSTYLDQTKAIPYYHYRIFCGEIDLADFRFSNKDYGITTSLDEFAEGDFAISYYENGYFYFKDSRIVDKSVIEYYYKNHPFTSTVEKITVWNIFDEFAMYVGLKRFEEEDNDNLLWRILFQSQHPVNSSKDGLINALANTLDINKKEIELEPVTNLNYLTEIDGKAIFDIVSDINRDIYCTKRWGVDYWSYPFTLPVYYPHSYDIKPSHYQQGIGDNADLEVSIVQESPVLHAQVKTYLKDDALITNYHKKYPQDISLNLHLYKPIDILAPLKIDALIEAGDLTTITNDDFSIHYKMLESVNQKRAIKEFIPSEYLNKFAITPFYPFVNGHSYAIKCQRFTPFGSFALLAHKNNASLLTAKNGFYIDEFGYLSHEDIGLCATHLGYFNICDNFEHLENGFGLVSSKRVGRLGISLDGLENKPLQLKVIEPATQQVEKTAFSLKSFYEQDGAYESIIGEEALFAIRKKANAIKFYVEGKALVILKHIDNITAEKEFIIENNYFSTNEERYLPTEYLIYVIPHSSTEKVIIKDIGYTDYQVILETAKGVIKDDIMPSDLNNTLYITLKTFTNDAPVLAPLYFGEIDDVLEYTTDPFIYNTNDVVELQGQTIIFTVCDLTDGTETVCDFTFDTYKAQEKTSIPLNLSAYIQLKDIYTDGGMLYKKDACYYLDFNKNDTCSYAKVAGEATKKSFLYKLNNMIPSYDEINKYYLSPIVEGIIEEASGNLSVISPVFEEHYGAYTITLNKNGIGHYFVTSQESIYQSYCCAPLKTVCLFSHTANQYKSYITQNLYQEEIANVPLYNNFSPFLPLDKILFFKTTSLTPDATVQFYTPSTSQKSNYSIDIKPLAFTIDYELSKTIQSVSQDIVWQTSLDKNMPLPQFLPDVHDNSIDLDEYVIEAEPGFEVIYESRENVPIENTPNILKTECFILTEDGFKKLKYCNIAQIIYISFIPYTENSTSTINAYQMIKKIGVLEFDKAFVNLYKGKTIYVHYIVNSAFYVLASIDKLYEKISFMEDAYLLTSDENYNTSNNLIECNNFAFSQASHITVEVREAGYKPIIEQENGIIRFIQVAPTKQVCIHDGFYYDEDDEYYLFGDTSHIKSFKNDYLEAFNSSQLHNKILLHSEGRNYVKNSLFYKTNSKAITYTTDFKEIQHQNLLNKINACEQINLWDAYNADISLNKGLYDLGISFKPKDPLYNYAVGMEVTFPKFGEYILSFWYKGTGTPKLLVLNRFKEEKIGISTLSKTITPSHNKNIYEVNVDVQPNVFYYLLLENATGTIDDLIMCRKEHWQETLHFKNSALLNLPTFAPTKNSTQRFFFAYQNKYKGYSEMTDSGCIQESSFIKYGYTPLLPNDWTQSVYGENFTVIGDSIFPTSDNAFCFTPVVKIDSIKTVEDICIQTNFFCDDSKKCPFIVHMGYSPDSLMPIHRSLGEKINILPKSSYIQIQCLLSQPLYYLDLGANYTEGTVIKSFSASNDFYSELFDLGTESECTLKHLSFKEYYDGVRIWVRVAKSESLFSTYQELIFDSDKKLVPINFPKIRYLQFKIAFAEKCHIDYFDVELTE